MVQDATGRDRGPAPERRDRAERGREGARGGRDRTGLGRAADRGHGRQHARRRDADRGRDPASGAGRARRVAAGPALRDRREGGAHRRAVARGDRRSPTARRRWSRARPARGSHPPRSSAGRRITVTGIVRRPYPTASDRRFAVLPRGGADVAIGPAGTGEPAGTVGRGSAAAGGTGGTASAGAASGIDDVTPDTDLATLARPRRRSGSGSAASIARVADDGFDLDDGTALARVELRGDMAALLPHLREGEAVAATGTVELVDGARRRGRRRRRHAACGSAALGAGAADRRPAGRAARPTAGGGPAARRRPTRAASAAAPRPASLLALAASPACPCWPPSSGDGSCGGACGPRSSTACRGLRCEAERRRTAADRARPARS